MRDPNALAREICRAGLPQVMGLLTNVPAVTDQAKVMIILNCAVDVVSRQPYLSQSLLTVLQSQPELSSLFSTSKTMYTVIRKGLVTVTMAIPAVLTPMTCGFDPRSQTATIHHITEKFGGLSVCLSTAKLKPTDISNMCMYVWQYRTIPPIHLNLPICTIKTKGFV